MNRLQRLRYDAGLTVDQLSDLSGIKRGTIYAIESGRVRRPRVDTVQPLAAVLKVPVSDLISDRLTEQAA